MKQQINNKNKENSTQKSSIIRALSLQLCLALSLGLCLLAPSTDSFANAFTSGMENAKNFIFRGGGYVPKAANAAIKSLDQQLQVLLGEHYPKTALRIAFTVPVNLNDFEKTNALARQMSEEIARGLKQLGYRVLEIRQGREIVMTPEVGEFYLTRKQEALSEKTVETELLMTGTYAVTSRGVRFSIRLLHMDSTEVIAMATTTVPVYKEIEPLLEENDRSEIPAVLAPTTSTRLQR